MPLLLDTDHLDAADRADAVRQVLSMTCSGTRISLDGPVSARSAIRKLGRSAELFTMASTGMTIQLPVKPLSVPPEQLVINVHRHDRGRHLQHGVLQVVGADGMTMVDMTAPYRWQAIGYGPSEAFVVDLDQAGLSVDDVRRSIPTFQRNPLAPLVHSHLTRLFANADELAGSPAAGAIEAGTLALIRALVTFPLEGVRARDALRETLLTRLIGYVRTHLREPDLTPERIAAANHISVRHLHATWSVDGMTLEQWIVAERLAGARQQLIETGFPERTIAQTASDWGFTDASHFSRRFRQAYGITPGELRRRTRVTWPSS